MFSKSVNYSKLKTNLRLTVNRMKLAEKKKTELAQKARKEIADYIQDDKIERAKIRVEQIIREDYLVEALELVEIYCDLLIARFGIINQVKNLDEGISEAVSSILYAAPILQNDIPEIKVVADILETKYGQTFAKSCRDDQFDKINEKLKRKLSIHSPPKALVEKYLVAIAKTYDVIYEPDPELIKDGTDVPLVDFSDKTNVIGFIGYPQPPPLPSQVAYNNRSIDYLTPSNSNPSSMPVNPVISKEDDVLNRNVDLPNIPSNQSSPGGSDSLNFDDLNRRFAELKKLK